MVGGVVLDVIGDVLFMVLCVYTPVLLAFQLICDECGAWGKCCEASVGCLWREMGGLCAVSLGYGLWTKLWYSCGGLRLVEVYVETAAEPSAENLC